MAELIVEGSEMSVSEWVPTFDGLRLYCWRHNLLHEIAVPDVEKILYALGPAPTDAYFSGYDDGRGMHGVAEPTRDRDERPDCWLEVLRWADDSEMYAEHVEQGIECRSKL